MPVALRQATRAGFVALLAVTALVAAGCGDDDGAPGGDAPARDALTITRTGGDGPAFVRELDCTGGDREACARIATLLPDLMVSEGEICTQIYGGPEVLRIEGTLDGEAVDATVDRTDGCQVARYDRIEAILG